MNKRIISFICVGLVATSCVSSLCFYDYFANDGTTSNPIYWIFDFFQLSILLGQAGIGAYAINALLRQKKEAISSLGYFAAHVFLQNITPLLQAWSAAVITEYPQWLLMSQVGFSIVLFLCSQFGKSYVNIIQRLLGVFTEIIDSAKGFLISHFKRFDTFL